MEDLQSLLEKINREGVEKADAEAQRIIAEAEAKAAKIVADAENAAAKAKTDAGKEAAASAARAQETLRQAARDVVLGVKNSVTVLLEQVLSKNVNKALADEKTASVIVTEAIKGLVGPGEITCGAKLAQSLNAQLATLKSFTVVVDESVGSGFTVKVDGGRVEHAFTGEAIAAELAKHLRPDLAKLLG